MDVKPLYSAADLARWDAFIVRSSGGTLFHTSSWKPLCELIPGDLWRVAAVENDQGEIDGGIVFVERRRLGLRLAIQPLGTPYIGIVLPDVVVDPGKREEIARCLLDWLTRQCRYAFFQNPPECSVLSGAGFRWSIIERSTPYVTLDDKDAMWSALKGNARRKINKVRKAGYQINVMERPVLFPDEREDMEHLLESTNQRVGQVIYPFEFVHALLADEQLSSRRLVLWARPGLGAPPEAMLAFVWDERKAYYLLPLASDEGLKAGAMYLLVWRAMKMLSEKGIKSLDMLGSNLPGLARFKGYFNGDDKPYHQLKYYRNPVIRILDLLRKHH